MQPVDHQARSLALDTQQSVCVTAPAGSGKTGLLVQRYIKLLAQVEQPEQILAVTFTRKAAAEMRERVLLALRAAERPQPVEEFNQLTWQLAQQALQADTSKNWNLIANPSRLRIQTIDSLAQSVASDMPTTTGMYGAIQAVDNCQYLYQMAITELFSTLDEHSNPSLFNLLHQLGNNFDALQRWLIPMLEKRDQWLGQVVQVAGTPEARVELTQGLNAWRHELFEQAHQEVWGFANELTGYFDGLLDNMPTKHGDLILVLRSGVLPASDLSGLKGWQALANWILVKDAPRVRSKWTKNEGVPADAEYKESFKSFMQELVGDESAGQALHQLRCLPLDEYSDESWPHLADLLEVLKQSVAHLQLVFEKQSCCDHLEISLAAMRALNVENSDGVALQWDSSLQHLLVDEFQDTSVSHFQLVEQLVGHWAHDDPDDRPRTAFIVGDAMQSIYRFRGAKVGLFIRAKNNGIGDLHLANADLQQNFRSSEALVEWNNRLYEKVFPAEASLSVGAVAFQTAVAGVNDGDSILSKTPVKLAALDVTDVDAKSRQAEATYIADYIETSKRAAPEESIAILIRARKHAEQILQELTRRDIAWVGNAIDPLQNEAAIADAMTVCKALTNPADQIAWAALLRAPWCGLTLSDLTSVLELADNNMLAFILSDREIVSLSEEGAIRFSSVRRTLQAAWQQRASASLRDWLEASWQALGGAELYTENAAEEVFKLVDELAGETDVLDLNQLEIAIEKLFRAADPDPLAVNVMTMHKSKGLEFDRVILPGMDKSAQSDKGPALVWREHFFDSGGQTLALASRNPNIKVEDDLSYSFLHNQDKEEARHEQARQLYVATTRAKKHMLITANVARNTKGEIKEPSKNSSLAILWPSLRDQFEEISPSAVLDNAVATENPKLQRWATASMQGFHEQQSQTFFERLAIKASMPSVEVPDDEITNVVQDKIADESRDVGILVHKVLEVCVNAGNTPSRDSLAGIIQVLADSFSFEERETVITKAEAVLNSAFTDERCRWILNNQHQESVAEWQLAVSNESGTRRLVIDRSFVDDYTRWIVDYKTGSPKQGQTDDSYLAEQAKLYAQQINSYVAAVACFEQRPIRAALYFPAAQLWYEYDLGS